MVDHKSKNAAPHYTLVITNYNYCDANYLTAPLAEGRCDVYYAYDLRNLQTEARFDSLSGEGLLSEYDGFGRLTKSITAMGGNSRYLNYQYDPDGNRTRLTFQDGNYVTSEYDGLDRPVWIRENGVERLGLLYYHPHGGRKIFHRSGTSTNYGDSALNRAVTFRLGEEASAGSLITAMGVLRA